MPLICADRISHLVQDPCKGKVFNIYFKHIDSNNKKLSLPYNLVPFHERFNFETY